MPKFTCPMCGTSFQGPNRGRRGSPLKRTIHCSNTCAVAATTQTPEERFWSKVDVRGPNDCWEWNAHRDKNGYGAIRIGGAGTPRKRAHRFAYESKYGAIADGLIVRHKCDNPPCCNPDHLEVGTTKDNAWDKVKRGRHRNQWTRDRPLPPPQYDPR